MPLVQRPLGARSLPMKKPQGLEYAVQLASGECGLVRHDEIPGQRQKVGPVIGQRAKRGDAEQSRHCKSPSQQPNKIAGKGQSMQLQMAMPGRWQAYRNDPLVDVAIALDNFAPTPDLEQVLLQTWLGQKARGSISDRLAKVRALTRVYYAGVFFSASAAASGALADHDISAPTVATFRRAILNGEITPGSPEAKHILGKMYLSSFMTGEIPPGLNSAV